MAHTQRQTNLHATATTAIDELLQTNKKQKQSEAASNTCTHNQYEYIHTHQCHVVSNTNRIYPVSQPGSQSAIYPSIQSYVRPSINASSKAFTNPFISIEMCEDYMFRQTRNCARICQATLTHLPAPLCISPSSSHPFWLHRWLTQPTPRAEVCTVFGLAQLKRF